MPELYRLVVLLPLAWTVLGTLLGRTQPFRVTPKALPSGRANAVEKRLLLPLLALLSLQVVAVLNLVPLLRGSARFSLAPVSASTLAVGLGWALLNTLLLLASLRCCRDRPRRSATPWLAMRQPLLFNGQAAELSAISEEGLELRLAHQPGTEAWAPGPGRLQLSFAGQSWPVQVAARAGPRLGCVWGPLDDDQQEQLQELLYQRGGQWPSRRAPAEPLALAATAVRLLRPMPAEDWFQRSLMPVLGLINPVVLNQAEQT
jgi:cellulose synthase (UDP-forming)